MIRILFFLLIVFALGLGFAWLADRPGDMVVTFAGYQYQVSLMVAAVAVTAIVAGVMISWWLIKSIWNSPYTIARYFRVRQRDRGYQALSTGMIAAGAGDATLARKMNKQAAKLIRSDTEPLIHLLDAQASLLEGDHDSAREKFERMLDDPEMRLLGLRGLYLEAERLGDRSAARHYAGRAADIAPQLGWAIDSTLEEKTARGDWDGALKLIAAQKSTRQVEHEVINRRRGVLLTAKAEDLFDTDPSAAKAAALEAHRLLPDFAPAAVIAAKTLFRQNDIRKGAKILEAAWKAEPHPDVADLYVHARPGDAVLDRLSRARKLEALRQNNVESSLIVARAALDAHEFKAAREAAEVRDPHAAARRRLPAARRHRGSRDRRPGPRAPVPRHGGARGARPGMGGGWFRLRALGSGLAGDRPARRLRMARSGRTAGTVDRTAGCRRRSIRLWRCPWLPIRSNSTTPTRLSPDRWRSSTWRKPIRRPRRTQRLPKRQCRNLLNADKQEPAEPEQAEPPRMPDDPGVDPTPGQSERRFRLF